MNKLIYAALGLSIGLLVTVCWQQQRIKDLEKEQGRVKELEERLDRLKTSYHLERLNQRTDALIDAANKIAKESKIDLGFWVPTPVPIAGQYKD